ncbi:hypothetical protein D049_0737A, partial [Vibrio parahaemolyticus VPTS-2010]
MFFILDEGH